MESMHLLACQPTFCLHLILLYLFFNNWLKRLISKPHNVFRCSNGKCKLEDTINLKLRSGESCERSHVKTKKTVMHCQRDQSQSVALSEYEKLPRDQHATGSSSISEKYQGAENPLTAAWLLWSRDQ